MGHFYPNGVTRVKNVLWGGGRLVCKQLTVLFPVAHCKAFCLFRKRHWKNFLGAIRKTRTLVA